MSEHNPYFDVCRKCGHTRGLHSFPAYACSVVNCPCLNFAEATPGSEAPAIALGIKGSKGKLRWSLLPWSALEPIVRVMEFGAKKYARDNWKSVDVSEYREALLRHVAAMEMGEADDPDSGLPHLDHLATNALFLIWFRLSGTRRGDGVTESGPGESGT